MRTQRALVVFVIFLKDFSVSQDVPSEATTDAQLAEGEKKMSEHILEILEHFKKPDPEGIPGANIPDPYPVPDMTKILAFGTLLFRNTAVYGTSKFRILYIDADIENMEVRAAMAIDKLQARGNYTYCTFMCFTRVEGPFTVDVTALEVTARATLGVELDGKLRAQDINMDMKIDTIKLNFRNLGLMGSVLQSVINTLNNFLFETIKPFILTDSNIKMRAAINAKLDAVTDDIQFPNTILPLDMILVDARNKMRETGMDPFKCKDQTANDGIFSITLSNTWLVGLSTFHRVGNITLKMENNTIIADLEIGTQKLEGSTRWDIAALGVTALDGTALFSIEQISGRLVLAQSVDARKRPELKDFDLDIGNMQVRCDGAGTIDYIIEFAVNILPNLLRQEVIHTLKGFIKLKLQEELNSINVEDVIKQEFPKMDELQKTGFKLSSLRASAKNKVDIEDEFFDF